MAEAQTADIPEIPEIIPTIAEIPEIIPNIPEQEETPAKKRGRPPGARNKPRIIVESLPAPEPAAPEPAAPEPAAPEPATPDPKKRQRKAVVPVLPEVARLTPAESFRAAMTAWSEMQAQDVNKKGEHYHKLVSAMFK